MLVTVSGIVTLTSFSAELNILLKMLVVPSSNVAVFKPLSANTSESHSVSDLGISTDVRDVQPAKARQPIN